MIDPARDPHRPPPPGGSRGQTPPPPPPGAPPVPPQPGAHPWGAPGAPRKKRHLIAPGVTLLVLGLLGIAAAVLIFIMPFGLFLLGGGGNTEAFDDFAANFRLVASLVAGVSVLMAGGGIALIVVAGRRG